MKLFILLAAFFACTLGATLPRIPLAILLRGQGLESDPKIVGGKEVTPNSLPFQISLQRRNSFGLFSHICGGSILDSTTILNAAHCLYGYTDPTLFQIVAGEHSLRTESGLEQTRAVKNFKLHESFVRATFENDIALLFLTSPLDLSVPSAAPVILPSPTSVPPSIVTVSGWGAISYGGPASDVLLSVDIPVVPNDECINLYKTIGDEVFPDLMFCAGDVINGGIDSCQGDSGGPVFTSGTGAQAIQHGIVSWGEGCSWIGFPGVYTRVSYFIDWIAANRF